MNSKDELYYSAIDLLHRLIGTPSISREEDAAAQIICETLQKNGFTPYRTGNNIWTFAREFDSEKPTVLLAHRYGKAHRQLESPALCPDRRR